MNSSWSFLFSVVALLSKVHKIQWSEEEIMSSQGQTHVRQTRDEDSPPYHPSLSDLRSCLGGSNAASLAKLDGMKRGDFTTSFLSINEEMLINTAVTHYSWTRVVHIRSQPADSTLWHQFEPNLFLVLKQRNVGEKQMVSLEASSDASAYYSRSAICTLILCTTGTYNTLPNTMKKETKDSTTFLSIE